MSETVRDCAADAPVQGRLEIDASTGTGAGRRTDAGAQTRAGLGALAETDPELVELFERFAFGDVPAQTSINGRTRSMVVLAALIAARSTALFKATLAEALDGELAPVEAKEITYHAVAYVGMAKAYDCIVAANEVFAERGIQLPLAPQATVDASTRFDDGLRVQKGIFGAAIDAAYENAPEGQRHIQEFLSANCFGDFYTRGGLDVKERELITFVLILSLGGCEPQVAAHVQGNLAVGNDRALLVDAVTELIPFIGYPRSLNALRCVNEVAGER